MNHAEQVMGAAPMGTAREMSCRWALRGVDRGRGGSKRGVQEGCRATRSSGGVQDWDSVGERAAQVSSWGSGLSCAKQPRLGWPGKKRM